MLNNTFSIALARMSGFYVEAVKVKLPVFLTGRTHMLSFAMPSSEASEAQQELRQRYDGKTMRQITRVKVAFGQPPEIAKLGEQRYAKLQCCAE